MKAAPSQQMLTECFIRTSTTSASKRLVRKKKKKFLFDFCTLHSLGLGCWHNPVSAPLTNILVFILLSSPGHLLLVPHHDPSALSAVKTASHPPSKIHTGDNSPFPEYKTKRVSKVKTISSLIVPNNSQASKKKKKIRLPAETLE